MGRDEADSRRSSSRTRASGPTSTTGIPLRAALTAPCTIAPGALSPPMASTATGAIVSGIEAMRLAGLGDLLALVGAAGRAGAVRQHRLLALRALHHVDGLELEVGGTAPIPAHAAR